MLLAIGLALGAIGATEAAGFFIAGGLLLALSARRRRGKGERFRIGVIAEERVGSRLWKLEELGWLLEHDVQKGGGGNIDHLVHSPAVTFVIETKAGAGKARDRAQVLRHAEWATRRYGGLREVVPIFCLQRSKQKPESIGGVYRVGASCLVDLMLDRG